MQSYSHPNSSSLIFDENSNKPVVRGPPPPKPPHVNQPHVTQPHSSQSQFIKSSSPFMSNNMADVTARKDVPDSQQKSFRVAPESILGDQAGRASTSRDPAEGSR